MSSLAVKAGLRLAGAASGVYAETPVSARVRVLGNFVGWAFAHRHDIPRSKAEFAAMTLVFETFLRERREDGWIDDFDRMQRAQAERQGWRARQWWRIYWTMRRALPMRGPKLPGLKRGPKRRKHPDMMTRCRPKRKKQARKRKKYRG